MTTSPALAAGALVVEDAAALGDPLLIFAGAPHHRRFYWEVVASGHAVVGLGSLCSVEAPSGPERFEAVAAFAERLSADGLASEAVLVGGFSFDDVARPGSMWAPYGTGRLTLPEIAITVRDNTSRVVRSPGAHLPKPAPAEVLGRAHHLAATTEPGADPQYVHMVSAAIEQISAGALDKVVCARSVRLGGSAEVVALLHQLRSRYPGCAVFAVAEGDQVFCGASPEVLLARTGDRVVTAAVAGTRPRGGDDAEDTALAAALLTDPKERAEHGFVLDEIRHTLGAAGVALDPTGATEVVQLRHVQHLRTPVTGRVAPGGAGLIELVGRLHPTPAVAGTPTAEARSFLSEWESFDRGWYAAPLGWVDGSGDGEFRVALRCGLIDPGGVSLFAGAGVVQASDPGRELDETTTKLRALTGALLGG